MLLPDLDSLRLLAAVARTGSIGAAGRVAGMSQQSASERLRAMEARTRLVLVQRSTAGSTLTAEGRLLVEWSTDLLQRADEIDTALATLREERTRELRVHASMTTAEYLLPGWLVRLRAVRSVSVSLHATNSEQVLSAVRAGDADLGVIEGPPAPAASAGLSSAVVGGDEVILVAAPDDPWAARRRPLPPGTLATRALTSREPGSGTRQVVYDALAAHQVTLAAPEVELDTNAGVLAAVRAGGAPGFVSTQAAERDLAAGTLRQVRLAELALARAFTAVWVGGPTPPAGPVRDLLAIAKAAAGPGR